MDRTSIFGLFAFIPLLFYLVIIIFGMYFIVRTIKYMNVKTKLDQERNQKLDSLIKVLQDQKDLRKE